MSPGRPFLLGLALLLPQDVPFVLERAAAHWDWRRTSVPADSSAGR